METSLKQRLKETAEHNARDRNADEEEHMKKKMSVITTPLNVQRLDSNPKPLIQNLDEKLAAMHKQAEDACEPLKGPVVVKNLDEKLAKMNATDNSSKWPEAKNEAPTKKAAVKVATAKAVATPTVSKRKAVKPIEYSDDDDDDVGEVTSPESRHVTQRRPGKARAVAQVRPKLSPAKSTIPEAQSQLQQGIPTKSQSTIATTTAAAMANRRVTLSRGKNAADVLTRLSTIQDKPESMQSVYQNSTQHMDVYDMPGSDDENDDLENRRMSSTGTKGRRSTTSTNTVSTATKARLSSAPGNKRKATPRKPAATSAAAKKQTRKGKQALNKNDDDDEENEEEDEVEVPVEQAEDSVTPYPDALVVTDKKGGVASSDTSTKPIALTTVLGSRVASIRGSNEGDNASVISQYGLSRHSTSMRSKPMTVLYPGMNANDHDGENESVKQSSVTAPWNLRPAPSVAKSTDDIENVVPIPDAWNKPKESAATVKQSSEPGTDKNKKSSSSVKTSGQSVVTTRATPLWKPAGPITSGARMRAPVPVLDTSAYEPMIGDENINADKKTPKATSATKSSKPTKKAVSDRTDAVNINDKENAGVNESTKRTTSVPSRVTRKALTPITEKEAEGEKERASSSILPAHDEQEDYDDGGQNDDNGFGFDGGNDSVVNDYEQPAPVEVEDPKVASKKSTGRGSQQNKENAGNEKKSTEKEPLSSSVTKHALRDSSTTRSSRIDPSPPDAPKASATPKAVLPTLTSSTTTTTTSMPVSSALSTGGEVAEKRGSGSSNSMLLNLSALPQKLISPPPMFGFSSAPAVQDPNQRPSVFDKIKQQLTASVSTSIPLSSTTADLKRSGVGSSREQVSKYAASTASGSDCGANSQHANEYIEPLDAFEPSQCQITEFVSPETNRSKRGRGGGALKADTDSDMDSPSHDHIQM